MGYRVSFEEMNRILDGLKNSCYVYAPAWDKRHQKVRFRMIDGIEDIVLDRQSDFSMKETYYPVSQTMYYFSDTNVEDSEAPDDKKILVFARPCDINGMSRPDHIFMENGGHAEFFYGRLREKVKVIMLECTTSFENCFCVSMGSNKTENYDAAVRIGEGYVLADVKDEMLKRAFAGMSEEQFAPAYVTENEKKLQIPQITDRSMLKPVSDLEYWKQFDERCIACGGCNTVCGTCTCFDTIDVVYKQGSHAGERRRVWSSCMLENFTETAGGGRSRRTQGANMRFKVLHKFYDYHLRFGGEEHMCVGCGRCDLRCPKKISFFDTVNGLNEEIQRMQTENAEG